MPDGSTPAPSLSLTLTNDFDALDALEGLDVDELAGEIAEGLAPDATALDALETFGVEPCLVPRLGSRDAITLGPVDGVLVANIGALPGSPASMRALAENVRWACAMVVLAERLGAWAPRSRLVHSFARAVAARVLELRGELAEDGAERWRPLIVDAVRARAAVRAAPAAPAAAAVGSAARSAPRRAAEGCGVMERDAFDQKWSELKREGWCDGFGGMEYRRVRGEWDARDRAGQDPADFIRRRAKDVVQ